MKILNYKIYKANKNKFKLKTNHLKELTVPLTKLKGNSNTVSTALMLYQLYTLLPNLDKNKIISYTLCILLSYKFNDKYYPLKDILTEVTSFFKEEINETLQTELIKSQEIYFLLFLNFEFKFCKFYDEFYVIANDFMLEEEIVQTGHVILNDSFYLPLFLVFKIESIIMSVYYLACDFTDKTDNSLFCFIKSSMKNNIEIEHCLNELTEFYIEEFKL